MRTNYYSLRIKPSRTETVIRVLHDTISVISLIGLALGVAVIIDGFFFSGRGFISVLIWILER